MVFAVSSLISVHVGLRTAQRPVAETFGCELTAFLGMSLVVLFAPFLAFSGKLLDGAEPRPLAYGEFAATYTRAFNAKWTGSNAGRSDGLLGTADIQSLADLANSYAVVHGLRCVPFDMLNVIAIVLAVAMPFFPLVFAVVSPIEVAKQVIQILL